MATTLSKGSLQFDAARPAASSVTASIPEIAAASRSWPLAGTDRGGHGP